MMMPNQNMFAARAGLAQPAGPAMMTTGPMSLPPRPMPPTMGGDPTMGGPGAIAAPPMLPPRPMPPQMGGPMISPEGPGMMPPGMMPPLPGGPSAGVMPWRGGMQRPATQGPQNFMRQRMGLM